MNDTYSLFCKDITIILFYYYAESHSSLVDRKNHFIFLLREELENYGNMEKLWKQI